MRLEFCKFSQKLHEIKNILGHKRKRTGCTPLLKSRLGLSVVLSCGSVPLRILKKQIPTTKLASSVI